MNNSTNVTRPSNSGPSIKKAAKHLDELDFLSTPPKNARRPLGTIVSGQKSNTPNSLLTPNLSARKDLANQDSPSIPFSPVSKLATNLISKHELTQSPLSGPNRSLKPSELRATFLNRLEKFKTIEIINEHLPSSLDIQDERSNIPRSVPLKFDFKKFKNPEKFQFRYMFEKLSDKSDVLDRHLEQAGSLLADWYEVGEWSDPTLISQDDIWAFGRICAETQDSKVSDQACWLETTRMIGHGRRIRLQWSDDLKVHGVGSSEGGIGLFPGAIVGLRGRNGGGTYFSVQEILSMPIVEPATTPPQTLLNFLPNDPIPISLIVACGPFTWDDDLDYLPFESLIEQLIKEQPDCVILLGPFIDANHSMIKVGNMTQMPSTIFRERISARIHELVSSSPRTHVILIPSPRDLLVTQVVYPQASLNLKDPELGLFGRNVVCLPNPSTISINEIVIGINNVDVLMPLRREEFFKPAVVVNQDDMDDDDDPNGADIISRACRHVMRQRSFYPLFPSAIGNGFDPINLDVTHLDLIQHDTIGADILILPTNFTAFAKTIDSTVIVNPRQLCKPKGTGTFARFTIHSFDKGSIENSQKGQSNEDGDEDGLEHLLFQRCRVDVVKL